MTTILEWTNKTSQCVDELLMILYSLM